MSERVLANFYIAIEAVFANKMRSILTALGIIFGVAAVIAMLAIGNGAQQEILEQIKLVGVNNIVIEPIIEQREENLSESTTGKEKKKFSPGLSLKDVNAIAEVVPSIERLSPEIVLETYIIKSGIRRSAKLVGVEPNYFELTSFELAEGKMFNDQQLIKGSPVCIIGKSIQTKFFPTENPIGKSIKCGPNWLTIIGVLKERIISESSIAKLGIRDFNMDVYAPIKTVLIRYENRDLVTKSMMETGNIISRGRMVIITEDNDESSAPINYHQIDKLVIQVAQTDLLNPVAEIISRVLERRHYEVIDYQITIPELLLKQQQRTNQIFNFVLGAIAGISLLVGGIGIMNIMLASVLERIKEIGLRLALGAKKEDIVTQFLFESVLISITGGLIGIILGIALAVLVAKFAEIPTIITFVSILLSFGVAATIGLIFGITPAKRAAEQDPITSLRYE
ncbi:MAG: ABC transporter permease [Cyclobacteriaceae bacterium]|nr:ABC transporter permease [Cyclobacteriaceae bacterium]MCK5208312.1 ABC transporter permease [Cyclobacteriaceae bacterium]MCK5277552.1 ABC transporter permease [Cyclobacteriaceae bacterium]MCK5702343.1 ABC transporter permease [Cyclobacteriaceae bacterium]